MKNEDFPIGSRARVVQSIFDGQIVTVHGHSQDMVLCYVTALDDVFEIRLSPELLIPARDGEVSAEPNPALPLLNGPLLDWAAPEARLQV
jgi:hypothetical protein